MVGSVACVVAPKPRCCGAWHDRSFGGSGNRIDAEEKRQLPGRPNRAGGMSASLSARCCALINAAPSQNEAAVWNALFVVLTDPQ